jgi:stearoyl-CoA desaturase (Delta-9 desaturase)
MRKVQKRYAQRKFPPDAAMISLIRRNLPKQKSPSDLRLTLVRWFDSWAGIKDGDQTEPPRIDWPRVVPFVIMHVACFGVLWVGWSWAALITTVALYIIRMFAITGFYHRYFSHRTFKTSRLGQFMFAVLGATAVQRGPLWWAAHHRHHHRHSDQAPDPHSPRQYGFLWSHMGWFTARAHFATQVELVRDLTKFPELCFLDRFDVVVPFLFAVTTYAFGVVLETIAPNFGTHGMQMLVWGFFVSTVLLYHGTYTINSLAHQLGSQRYDTQDKSGNSLLLAFITLGEGWHNNHHHYPASARQGFYWWEIDLTYYLLVLLSWTGLIWDLKPVPPHVRNARHSTPALAA